MLDWRHLLSQNPRQYQACYAPQSGSGLDIDVNFEESNQADQCRYPRPERRYSLCRNRGTVSPKYSTMFQKQVTLICVIISEKLQTASGDMFLNMLDSMLKNMLKLPNISTREHSRLHLVSLYDSFLVCWSKTNCTPAKNWTPN